MSACCHLTPNILYSQLLFDAAESRTRSLPPPNIIMTKFVVAIMSPICQGVSKGAHLSLTRQIK